MSPLLAEARLTAISVTSFPDRRGLSPSIAPSARTFFLMSSPHFISPFSDELVQFAGTRCHVLIPTHRHAAERRLRCAAPDAPEDAREAAFPVAALSATFTRS